MTAGQTQRYVPAAGRAALTRLYDPIVALTMRETRWRPAMLERVSARVPPAGTVLDVGAGTGSFAIALAAARPDLTVIGVDGDPDVLARARAKPGADAVGWREGLAGELPIAPGSADAVTMSLVLHHLGPDAKRSALRDIHRVLRPGGRLHVADWGRPRGPLPRAGFAALRVLDGLEGTRDHAAGRLAGLIAEAGYDEAQTWKRLPTVWGTLELIISRAASGDPRPPSARR